MEFTKLFCASLPTSIPRPDSPSIRIRSTVSRGKNARQKTLTRDRLTVVVFGAKGGNATLQNFSPNRFSRLRRSARGCDDATCKLVVQKWGGKKKEKNVSTRTALQLLGKIEMYLPYLRNETARGVGSPQLPLFNFDLDLRSPRETFVATKQSI